MPIVHGKEQCAADKAGGLLTMSTRPTSYSNHPSPRICMIMSIHPDGETWGHV